MWLLSTRSILSVSLTTFSQALCSSERNGRSLLTSRISSSSMACEVGTLLTAPSNRSSSRKVTEDDIEDDIAFKRCGPQYVEASWILQAKYEFAVGHHNFSTSGASTMLRINQKVTLREYHDLHARLQRTHLLFTDTFRTFEVWVTTFSGNCSFRESLRSPTVLRLRRSGVSFICKLSPSLTRSLRHNSQNLWSTHALHLQSTKLLWASSCR